jgi:NAD(P)-dependent dehydrogenase (short-subunit alcohol dehydrogenase family)
MTKLTIVITGSTRGIGHGLAMEFLQRGHQVILNGRNTKVVEGLVKNLLSQGYDALGVPGDVREERTFQSIEEQALKKYGKIDIWINNAGIPNPTSSSMNWTSRRSEAWFQSILPD